MRAGFYLSAHEPVERVLPQIALKALDAGERMLVVAEDDALLARLDKALWEEFPEAFLAHGRADQPHAERQPLLLSSSCDPLNGAALIAFADGVWREQATGFSRAFLFFDEAGRAAAQRAWASLKGRPDVTREFHEHVGGKWRAKA